MTRAQLDRSATLLDLPHHDGSEAYLLERPEAAGEIFNVGNARSVVTISDLAARVRRLTGTDVDIIHRPLHYTDVEMRIPNVDKARKLLGWEAKVDLDEGLARTIAWYRERRPALA